MDANLLARLMREAAWCRRDVKMLRTLTNRAYQFLADYDCQCYTTIEIHRFVMEAVGEAMRVTTLEEDNIKLLRELDVNVGIQRHQRALAGELSFPLWPSRRMPTVH